MLVQSRAELISSFAHRFVLTARSSWRTLYLDSLRGLQELGWATRDPEFIVISRSLNNEIDRLWGAIEVWSCIFN